MLNFLYTVIIYPLIEIIEFVYVLSMRFAKHPGFAIIGVSIAVTLLCLPLYAIAEKLQQEERETQKRLKPKVDKIKAVFKGDEQYMILSTYYKQNHYHPIYALRSSISLLIQIPFFMAAYSFLSNLSALHGVSFFFIKNLGMPDAMISLGNFNINFLPIAMTLINCVAGAIYTKGFPLKEKLQLYGMALIFLVLLYTSPSGLVLYWTMNNVFSLVKNIFYKLKNPLKSFFITMVVLLLAGNIFILIKLDVSLSIKVLILFVTLFVCITPLIYKFIYPLAKKVLKSFHIDEKAKNSLFIFSCIAISLLCGLVIPTTTISSYTADYCFIQDFSSPSPFIKTALFQSLGLFLFWPVCFYFLFNRKVKTVLSFSFFSLLIIFITNAFGFTNISETMSNTYMFTFNQPSLISSGINLLVLICLLFVITLLFTFKHKIANLFTVIITIAFIAISLINISTIKKDYSKELLAHSNTNTIDSISPVYHLSKTENNVIVIMIDRAISQFIPDLFSERPELNQQYKGFTYYPNSLSFGKYTNIATSGLWGGYEYSPINSNKRTNVSILQKQNESLKLLPTLFSKAGYNIYASDLPYANLNVYSDMTILNDIPNAVGFNSLGAYTSIWGNEHNFEIIDKTKEIILRNTLWYSIFKCCPVIFRFYVYENGNYWSSEFKFEDKSKNFIDSYAELDYLPRLTGIDSDKPCCILIDNETPHEELYLQLPDYVPSKNVNNDGFSNKQKDLYYQSTAATILRLGTFMDYLKENEVYDNTRIIIVSDHGNYHHVDITNNPFVNDDQDYRYRLNCTLLFKDFNSSEDFYIDNKLMTNGDTPYLATKDIIQNPINPFTGNPITSEQNKQNGVVVTSSSRHRFMQHGTNTFTIKNDEWFTVKDNLFDMNNWMEGINE